MSSDQLQLNFDDGRVDETPLRIELETRYLAYALSTIISRSLPDVRDGLKPVHRRILYAMRALRLEPGTRHKNRRGWSVMSSVNFIPMVIRQPMMPWYGWPKISPYVIPW